jgi:hypothetical protein
MNEITYKCDICGKQLKASDEKIPTCCGKLMQQLPLDICIQPAHPEHARSSEDDEPCDDGRAG